MADDDNNIISVRQVKQTKHFITRNWKSILIILAVIGIGLLAYGYIHTKNQLDRLSNPQTANKDATQQIADKVSRLAQLPSGETPTLATINDVSKLKSQPFFDPAQNGDKVLIYSKSGWAVLYRPSTNKVIEFSKINLAGGQ